MVNTESIASDKLIKFNQQTNPFVVRVTMYLKLEADSIFTPVHLSPVRLNQLIRTLKDKFPVFKESQVQGVLFYVVIFLNLPDLLVTARALWRWFGVETLKSR